MFSLDKNATYSVNEKLCRIFLFQAHTTDVAKAFSGRWLTFKDQNDEQNMKF